MHSSVPPRNRTKHTGHKTTNRVAKISISMSRAHIILMLWWLFMFLFCSFFSFHKNITVDWAQIYITSHWLYEHFCCCSARFPIGNWLIRPDGQQNRKSSNADSIYSPQRCLDFAINLRKIHDHHSVDDVEQHSLHSTCASAPTAPHTQHTGQLSWIGTITAYKLN